MKAFSLQAVLVLFFFIGESSAQTPCLQYTINGIPAFAYYGSSSPFMSDWNQMQCIDTCFPLQLSIIGGTPPYTAAWDTTNQNPSSVSCTLDTTAGFSPTICTYGAQNFAWLMILLNITDGAGCQVNALCTLQLNTCTSVAEEYSKSQIFIYPCPAEKFITIVTTETQQHELIIYNALGEEKGKWTFDDREKKIDIANFTSGIYSCKIIAKTDELKKIYWKKIVIAN